MARVIVAPEQSIIKKNEKTCFLAGGITNCYNWQAELLSRLDVGEDDRDLVVFNPRRADFPIDDPNAAQEQISWEFEHLEKADLFSIYFCSGKSDQPICMYELGRYIERMKRRFPRDWDRRIIVTVEDGYKRKSDVIIQTSLATGGKVIVNQNERDNAISVHACEILRAFMEL